MPTMSLVGICTSAEARRVHQGRQVIARQVVPMILHRLAVSCAGFLRRIEISKMVQLAEDAQASAPLAFAFVVHAFEDQIVLHRAQVQPSVVIVVSIPMRDLERRQDISHPKPCDLRRDIALSIESNVSLPIRFDALACRRPVELEELACRGNVGDELAQSSSV